MAKFFKNGVTWGGPDKNDPWYHFYWWNWLPPEVRYIGYCQDWYDGPMSSFGFWFFNWTWCGPFTWHNGKKSFSYHAKKKPLDTKPD